MSKTDDAIPREEPEEWTTEGFLDEFMDIEKNMKNRTFLFLLGAGASVCSGIPAGGTMARRWVEELYRRFVGDSGFSLEEWATPENLGIPNFSLERVAEFYPQVYDRRFGQDPDRGYADLENAMSQAKPDIGYSVLAQILAKTRHKVVITTNFDNLVADALAQYADTFPLVCGHESLAGFVQLQLRRPLVAKIHRDLLLAPQSASAEVSRLDERWVSVLRRLLGAYTPLVIGYGGNDGSLMDFLESLSPKDLVGGVFWCYRREDGRPSDRIRRLVMKLQGRLVPIVGFDEFMLQLNQGFGWSFLVDEIERKHTFRIATYRENLEKFGKNLKAVVTKPERASSVGPVIQAFDETIEREESWWGWVMKARAERNLDRREQIYRQGISQFPKSAELLGNFALFMHQDRKDHAEAERLYRKALELDPNNAVNLGNFGLFMWTVRKDYSEAERFYMMALELDPSDAANTRNLSVFMEYVRKDYAEAERLYRRALELDPMDVSITCNFANFVWMVRKNHEEAERLYRKALELDPNDANSTVNFAGFLVARLRLDEALEMLRRAWKLDQGQSNVASAELLLYWCLIARQKEKNERPGLARLKHLLTVGFERGVWSFDEVLAAAKDAVEPTVYSFYSQLAGAILNPDEVARLATFDFWTDIEPVDLEQSWDMAL